MRKFTVSAIIVIAIILSGCEEPDTTDPLVSITSPITETVVSEIAPIFCTATDDGGIDRVELWLDGVSTELVDDTEPYAFNWNSTLVADYSTHIFTVRAYDINDNVADSEPITITVDQSEAYPEPAFLFDAVMEGDSITISWTQNIDTDFSAYALYEAFHADMLDKELIYTSSVSSQNTYTFLNPEDGEERFFQVFTRDEWDFISTSNIITFSLGAPLVGSWSMNNIYQYSEYYMADNSLEAMGFPNGSSIGETTMNWPTYSSLGGNMIIELLHDHTYNLSGVIIFENDTLGYNPMAVPLTDAGIWLHDEVESTIVLDGGFYDLGGLLELDNPENPSTLTILYAEDKTSERVLMLAPGWFHNAQIRQITQTQIGFLKE